MERETGVDIGSEKAEAEATKRGCAGDTSGITVPTRGTLAYTRVDQGTILCRLLLGIYSGRVFYEAGSPRPPEDR